MLHICSLCEVELQKQINHFRYLVYAIFTSMGLQLFNVFIFVPQISGEHMSQVFDLIYWAHLSCIYVVMWHFAMMFFFPCNLYYHVQKKHIFVQTGAKSRERLERASQNINSS